LTVRPPRVPNGSARRLFALSVAALSVALAGAGTTAADDIAPTVWPHPDQSRWWLSGQVNAIFQWHPGFPAPYTGANSLRPDPEHALSRLMTLYTGARPTRWSEVLLDVESAGGGGISDALGLAGFTNLDVVRNPALGAKPYLARLTGRIVVPLGGEEEDAARGPLSTFSRLPVRRLELRAGKISLADVFDANGVGSDSHLQFTNWTVDQNGAYDYAADTRGYTGAVIVEYEDRHWGARCGLALMPTVANGIRLDTDVARARGENLEVEVRSARASSRPSAVRLLAFRNVANMGSYREAIDAFRAGRDAVPDVVAHRRPGRVKYGFGANLERDLGGGFEAFARAGWSEGRNESFAYTEVSATLAVGAARRAVLRRHGDDRIGLALVTNGISGEHREYLALGGRGFLLGDGRLRYGPERILEGYYAVRAWRGITASVGATRIWNPGYNRDRGPVIVPMLRVHVEL
jgi:hypothetical protein